MDGATQEWDPSIGLSLEMGSSSIGSDGGTGVCCGCNAMDSMAGVCAVSETFPIRQLQQDMVNLRLHLKLLASHRKIDLRNSVGKMPLRLLKLGAPRLL